jgi:hypothetical protein
MTTHAAMTAPATVVTVRSCFVCGSTRRIESHHVAPGWPLIVWLCHECHRCQTRLAWAAGVLGVPETVERRMWAVAHGLIALAAARAHAMGGDATHLCSTHRAVLRLLSEITEVPLGPDPARNTYREP